MLYLESYPYTEDLIKLDSCHPKSRKWSVDERLSGIFTPLDLHQWESMLENHPDMRYVNFILSDIYICKGWLQSRLPSSERM